MSNMGNYGLIILTVLSRPVDSDRLKGLSIFMDPIFRIGFLTNIFME